MAAVDMDELLPIIMRTVKAWYQSQRIDGEGRYIVVNGKSIDIVEEIYRLKDSLRNYAEMAWVQEQFINLGLWTIDARMTTAEGQITALQADKHNHSNKAVLDGITQEQLDKINTLEADKHTHSNKAILDSITQTQLSQIDTNKTNISNQQTSINSIQTTVNSQQTTLNDHASRITYLEQNGGGSSGGGSDHTHSNLEVLQKLRYDGESEILDLKVWEDRLAGALPDGGSGMDYLAREWARQAIIGQMKLKLQQITEANATKTNIQGGYADTYTDNSNIYYSYSNNIDVFTGQLGYIQPSVSNNNLSANYLGQIGTLSSQTTIMPTSAVMDYDTNIMYFVQGQILYRRVNGILTNLATLPYGTSAMQGTAIAYDSDRKQIWMFGGISGSTYFNIFSRYDLQTGTIANITTNIIGTKPSILTNSYLTYDQGRKLILLYGGSNGAALLNTTYEINTNTLDIVAFTNSSPSTAGRVAGEMWYNLKDKKIYMHGGNTGQTAPNNYNDRTFVWDTSTKAWVEVVTANKPPIRFNALYTYIPNFGLFLHGGTHPTNGTLFDMWFFDGTDWRQISYTINLPPPTATGVMGLQLDEQGRIQVVVLFNKSIRAFDLQQLNGTNSVVTFLPISMLNGREILLWAEGEGLFEWEVSVDNGNTFYKIRHDGVYFDISNIPNKGSYAVIRCMLYPTSRIFGHAIAWL